MMASSYVVITQFEQTPQWSNGNRAVPIARKGKCQIRGHVSRRHGCTAQIEVAMSLEYAVRIGIHTPQVGMSVQQCQVAESHRQFSLNEASSHY